MQRKLALIAVLAASVYAQGQDLNATLAANNATAGLASLLGQFPDLAQRLNSAQNITLLAPSTESVQALTNSSAGQQLASDQGLAQALLEYHVLNGTYASDQIPENVTWIPSSLTNETYANVTGGQRVGVVRENGTVTVISGAGSNTTVTQADIKFNGGYIHVINDVLSLPTNLSSTASGAGLTAVYGALVNASLVQGLESLRDITVFAPNNEAFQAIGSVLANASTQDLTSILGYHIVNGSVDYESILDERDDLQLNTFSGGTLKISQEDNNTFVNGARIVQADILISNGVVHVIDNVLNPQNSTQTPAPSATTGAPAFGGATSASDVPFTSNAPSPTGTAATSAGGSRTSGAPSSSTRSGGAMPANTGAMGAAALFGAGAAWMNL